MNLAEGPGEIELPSLPTSKEEVLELYKKSKEPISSTSRFASFVSPAHDVQAFSDS